MQYVAWSRRLAWDEIVEFSSGKKRNLFGEEVMRPLVRLRSGESRVLPGADTVLWSGKRSRVLEELENHRFERFTGNAPSAAIDS